MDFAKIVLADTLGFALVGGARREGSESGELPDPDVWRGLRHSYSRALDLLLLFDQVVLPEMPGDNAKMPRLQDAGIVTVTPVSYASDNVAPLETVGNAMRPDATNLLRAMAIFQPYREMTLDAMMAQRSSFDKGVIAQLGISRRKYYVELLDFAIAVFTQPSPVVFQTKLARRLPRKAVARIASTLFTEPLEESLNVYSARLFVALAIADEFKTALGLSLHLQAVVASGRFGSVPSHHRQQFGAESIDPAAFATLRALIKAEVPCFPAVSSVAEALRLRRDHRLKGLRERLAELNAALYAGDRDATTKCSAGIRIALERISKARNWERYLRWLTYLSLPAGVAETLLLGTPFLSTSLSVASAAGTAKAHVDAHRSSWVLFGTP